MPPLRNVPQDEQALFLLCVMFQRVSGYCARAFDSSDWVPGVESRYTDVRRRYTPCFRLLTWCFVDIKLRTSRLRNGKHTLNPPQIRFIVQNRSLHNAFEAKRQAIDASYNFKAEGMFPANERRKEKCTPGSMFGKGVYTSGTSSKSHGYVKQVAPSRYRAMLMCRVLAGRAKKLTTAHHNLVAAPTGYDSVRGVPGGGLNYDELIVYDNNQIRSLHLAIYDST